MKTRIISAIVGLLIFAILLTQYQTIIFTIVIDLVSLIAVFELLRCVGLWKHKDISVISLIFASVIPFLGYDLVAKFLPALIILYVFCLFIILLLRHNELKISDLAMAFIFSLLYPLSFTCLILTSGGNKEVGYFYLALTFAAAWMSDTGAYFTGVFLGKHKLCPEISPKKTVEGAIGGLAAAIISYAIIGIVFEKICTQYDVNYLILLVIAPFASVLGMMGDLSASVIKRQYGIKDYGNIMPGHGGVMDRFDSVLFVLPLIYAVSVYLPIV